MTTTSLTTLTATVATLTTDQLTAAVDEARVNMLRAWREQNTCTVDDGYSLEQAIGAIVRAQDAQAIYYMLHAQLEARLVEVAQLDEPDYYMTVDGLQSYEPAGFDGEIPF